MIELDLDEMIKEAQQDAADSAAMAKKMRALADKERAWANELRRLVKQDDPVARRYRDLCDLARITDRMTGDDKVQKKLERIVVKHGRRISGYAGDVSPPMYLVPPKEHLTILVEKFEKAMPKSKYLPPLKRADDDDDAMNLVTA